MEFFALPNLKNRKAAGLLVLPFFKGAKAAEPAADLAAFKSIWSLPITANDFAGKLGETLFLYSDSQPEKRIVLLGLGEEAKITIESLRRAYGALTKACRQKKIKEANILLPHLSEEMSDLGLKGITEGILLANYSFDKLKKQVIKDEPTTLLTKVTYIGADKQELTLVKQLQKIAQGVYLARDLVNDNADQVTPHYLGNVVKELSKQHPSLKTTVFDKKRIEKEQMGLLLAVSRGAAHDPAFIICEYKGAPKSKDLTVLVGKGVTYDTGGLNMKPTGLMETMKADMGGAATLIGTMLALANLGLKINVTAVIPAAENAVSGTSYKPGDVYTSYAGKTVEIGNTDAEGRLILADALAYAVKNLKPTRMIDFATLTAAVEIALGSETTGLMANNDELANALIRSGEETHERICRLPLFDEYRDTLKSEIADMKNVGGRPGGAIIAGMFLKDFVGDVPWAHFDIAGTAYLSEAKRYLPKYGTGVGVRLIIDYFTSLSEKKL